jgi:uncharacterized Zn-finger protein
MKSCCEDLSSHPKMPSSIKIDSTQLPLHCPLEGAPLWSLHPRVFLPIEKGGEVICPYCSTTYQLKD